MKRRVPFFYGYVILAAAWLMYFCIVGMILYGASVVNAQMQLALDFDEQHIGLAGTACTMISGLMGPAVGQLIARRGVRLPYLIGSGLVALASFALAFLPQDQWSFLFFYGVVVGAGIGFAGIMTGQSAVNDWFDQKKSMAMAIMLTAGAAGGFLAPQAVEWLLARGDWTWGWCFIGCASLFAFAVAALLVVDRPADIGQLPDGRKDGPPPQEAPGGDGFSFRQVLRGEAFYLLLFSYASRTALYYTFMAYIIIYLRALGLSTAFGATLLSLVSVGNLAGRLITGALPERLVPTYVSLALGNLILGGGTLLVVLLSLPGPILLGGILFGVGIGVCTVALPVEVARVYGSRRFSVVNGNLSFLNYLCGAGGPALVGWTASLLGSYRLPFLAVALLCAGGGACSFRLKGKEGDGLP